MLLLAGRAAGAQAVNSEPYTWKPVTITAGGFITGIVFSPKEPGLAFCRTDIGGAYRWDARAKQWVCLTDWVGPRNANLGGCESVAVDPTNADKVYLALGTYDRGAAAIARSADRGKTFTLTAVPIHMGANEDGRGMGERLAVDPSDPRVVYFGSRSDGLWRSVDGAATWAEVDAFPRLGGGGAGISGSPGLPFVIFDPRPTDKPGTPTAHILVGATGGTSTLFHSKDGGQTWAAVAGGPAPTLLPHRAALDSVKHVLYISYGNGPGPNNVTAGAVAKYDLDANRWTDITPNNPGNGGYGGIALDRQHPDMLMVSTIDHWGPSDAIFRSTDGGATWRSIDAASDRIATATPYMTDLLRGHGFDWWLAALAIDPFDSNHVLFGTGATIWGTHNADDFDAGKRIEFHVEAEGIEETAVLALASPPWGDAHLISGEGDIGGFTHTDFTVSPVQHQQNPGFTNTTAIEFAEHKPVVVRTGTANRSSGGGTAAYSEDGGITWRPLALPAEAARAGGTARGSGGQGGTSITISADGTTLLTGGSSVMFSRDKGTTWQASAGLPAGAGRPVADRVALATFYIFDMARGQVYVSVDGGATFAPKSMTGVPTGNGALSRVKASFARQGELWGLVGAALCRSLDGGQTWMRATNNITVSNYAFGKSAPNHENAALFIAGTVNNVAGLFRSDDNGATWVRINDDAHQFGGTPTVMTGDPRVYGRLYIGMNGRGILYGDPTP